MTTYDKQLRLALAPLIKSRRLQITEGSADTFTLLERSFPMSGSKIEWAEIPMAQQANSTGETDFATECIAFWERVARTERLAGLVTYVCDGAIDFSVETMVPEISAILPAVLEIPQHHYLVGAAGAWCVCFTMEGDIDFGRSPAFSGFN